jgi:hypothetical protein
VMEADLNVPNLDWGEAYAQCSPGKHVLGGGFWVNSADVTIIRSQPVSTLNKWYAAGYNHNLFTPSQGVVWAICANTSG